MKNASDLKRELDRINGRGYKSYKDFSDNLEKIGQKFKEIIDKQNTDLR